MIQGAAKGVGTLAARSRKIDKSGECWVWTGATDADGYGLFRFQNRIYRTHRVAWEEEHGRPVPDGLGVLHSCDNPPCVNPAHLRVGTALENTRDKMSRGRWRGGRPKRVS